MLLQLDTEMGHRGVSAVSRGPTMEFTGMQEWLLHLPKTLWELGANNLGLSEASIANFSLHVISRRSHLCFFSIDYYTRVVTNIPAQNFSGK